MDLYTTINNLRVTVEEDLVGANTPKKTVTEVEKYLKDINNLWNQYKKENNL